MSGFFLVQHGTLDHDMLGDQPYCPRAAWIWLIDHGSFAPHVVEVNGFKFRLGRGQCCYAQRFLAKAWKWNLAKVSRFLKRLEAAGAIKITSETPIETPRGTHSATPPSIITLCNYERFQAATGGSETPSETPRETPSETNKKEGLEKEGLKESGSADFRKILFDRAREVLGKSGTSLAGKLLKLTADDEAALARLNEAASKSDPRSYLAKIIQNLETERDGESARMAEIYRGVL